MGNDAIDYINRDIVNVKEELRTISKLVRDGNGQPSLMTQVTMLHSDIVRLESELKEQIQTLQSCAENLKNREKERSTTSWQFKTAIAVALISSFTSIYLHTVDSNRNAALETEKTLVHIIDKLDKMEKDAARKK